MKSEGQRRSRRQEERTAKAFGGRRTPGSGATWARKGDVRTPFMLIENKWTGKLQITLKAVALEKICDEATAEGVTPALAIELNGRRYVLFTEDDVLEYFVDRMGAPGVAWSGEVPGVTPSSLLPGEGGGRGRHGGGQGSEGRL